MTSFTFFLEAKEPWLSISSKQIALMDLPDDVLLLSLNGSAMNTLEKMYKEFSSVLHFPDYFGQNFNAFDECLTDLEWLPAKAYLLVISDAEFFLCDESEDVLESVITILNDAGAEWATPVHNGEAWDRDSIPFHVIFELDKNKSGEVYHKFEQFGIVEVRF